MPTEVLSAKSTGPMLTFYVRTWVVLLSNSMLLARIMSENLSVHGMHKPSSLDCYFKISSLLNYITFIIYSGALPYLSTYRIDFFI